MKQANRKMFLLKTFIFILLLILIIIGCILGLKYFYDSQTGGFWVEILTAFLSTLISIIILSLGFQIFTNQQQQWDIQQKIMRSLGGDSDIIGKYHKESIKKILYNCFPPLLDSVLAPKFVDNVISKQIANPSYRRDYDYDVEISTTGETGKYRVLQTLSYRKCINGNETRPKFIKFCFAFSEDPFHTFAKEGTTIFFREVINDQNTQAMICDNAGNNAKILEILDFHFSIGEEDITGDIECQVEKAGVILSVGIPPKQIIEKEWKSEAGDYRNTKKKTFEYEAEMKCAYDSSCRFFYCAFPEPTIGARFTIRFNGVGLENVQSASFLSSDNYRIFPDKAKNQMCMRIKDKDRENIIFPHSGVVFFWN